MGKANSIYLVSLLATLLLAIFNAAALEVMITPEIGAFSVKHAGKELEIRRNQDTDALLEFDFARTSRPCPPFAPNRWRWRKGSKLSVRSS